MSVTQYDYFMPINLHSQKTQEERRIIYNALPVILSNNDSMLSKSPSGKDIIVSTTWYTMRDEKKLLSIENVQTRPSKPQLDGTVFSVNNNDDNNFHSLRVNTDFLKKKKKEKEKLKIDGNVLNRMACALCEYKFSKENLPYIISVKAIYNKRAEWGLPIPFTKEKWNTGYMYGQTRICRFCNQLFQPKISQAILPDPPTIFHNEEHYKLDEELTDSESSIEEISFEDFYHDIRMSEKNFNKLISQFVSKEITGVDDVHITIPKKYMPIPPKKITTNKSPRRSFTYSNRNFNEEYSIN